MSTVLCSATCNPRNSCFTSKPLKIHHFLLVKYYKIFTTFKVNLNAKQFFPFSGEKLLKMLPPAPGLGGRAVSKQLAQVSYCFLKIL